uniref:Endonuclease/exonuclease/phosphatase domain-containing protein n=1 Tax=Sinocyclocheilus grahami TaxID=75366 RepID=A0A672QRP5_SINGR
MLQKIVVRNYISIVQRLNELQASVAFLQETHIGINDVSHLKDIDGWEPYFSVHHPCSKGVAILIKNESSFEHIKHDIEPTGSYIVLICKLYGKCFTLVNVYNHAKEHKVLQCLSEYLRQTARGVLIVAGDFNTVLNTDLDRQYPTGHAEPLRPYLEEFISSLMLVDVWGLKNCCKRDSFTRFPWKPSKQKNKKHQVRRKRRWVHQD